MVIPLLLVGELRGDDGLEVIDGAGMWLHSDHVVFIDFFCGASLVACRLLVLVGGSPLRIDGELVCALNLTPGASGPLPGTLGPLTRLLA